MAIWNDPKERATAYNNTVFVTDDNGELLEDGKVRTRSGKIIDEENQDSISGLAEILEANTASVDTKKSYPDTKKSYPDTNFLTAPEEEEKPKIQKESVITENKTDGDYGDDFVGQESFNIRTQVEPIRNPRDEFLKEQKRRESIEDASVSDKIAAFWNQAGKDHLGGDIAEWLATKYYTDFKKDDNYQSSEIGTVETITRNGIPMDSYGELMSAESQAEYDFILRRKLTEKEQNKQIENSLGKKTQMFASITGMVGDLDMAVGYGVGKLLKTQKLMKLAAAEGSVEAALAYSRSQFSDNYYLKDAIVDIGIGTAVAVGVTKYFNRAHIDRKIPQPDDETMPVTLQIEWKPELHQHPRIIPPMPYQIKSLNIAKIQEIERIKVARNTRGTPEYKAEQTRVAEVVEKIRRSMGISESRIIELAKIDAEKANPSQKEFNAEFKATQREANKLNKKIQDVERNFDEEAITTKEEARKYYDELAEMRTKAAEYRNKLYGEEATRKAKEQRLFEEHEQRRIKEEQVREDQYRQNRALAEKFKDEKYKEYNVNRREFYKKQDEINRIAKVSDVENLKASRLKSIELIKRYTKELKAEKSLPTPSSRKVGFREKKIKELNNEIIESKRKIDELSSPKTELPKPTKAEAIAIAIVDDMMEDIVSSVDEMRDIIKNSTKAELEGIQGFIDVIKEMVKREPKIAKEKVSVKLKVF